MGFTKTEFLGLYKTMMALDFSSFLEKISCRTLIIYGEKDSANKSASVEMVGMIKNAELYIIRGVGHEINTEVPEKLAEILRDFYSGKK